MTAQHLLRDHCEEAHPKQLDSGIGAGLWTAPLVPDLRKGLGDAKGRACPFSKATCRI